MIFFRHYGLDRFPGDTGGDSAKTKQDAGADGGKAGGNAGGDTSTKGDDKSKLTPEQQLAELTKERDGLKAKNVEWESKYGKQSEDVGRMKKIAAALTNQDPAVKRQMLLGLAKTAGFSELYFEKPKADGSAGANTGGDGKTPVFDHEAFTKSVNAQIKSTLDPMMESVLAGKYSDWNALAEERANIAVGLGTGDITEPELLQFAARGRSLDSILKAHKDTVIAEYNEELTKKNQGHISDGGAGGAGKITTKKSVETFEEALQVFGQA